MDNIMEMMHTAPPSPLNKSEYSYWSSISQAPFINNTKQVHIVVLRVLLIATTVAYAISVSTFQFGIDDVPENEKVSEILSKCMAYLRWISLLALPLHTMLASLYDIDILYLIHMALYSIPYFEFIRVVMYLNKVYKDNEYFEGDEELDDLIRKDFAMMLWCTVASCVFWILWGIPTRIMFLKTFTLAKHILILPQDLVIRSYAFVWFALCAFVGLYIGVCETMESYTEEWNYDFALWDKGAYMALCGGIMGLEILLYNKINPLRYNQSRTISEICYMISIAVLFALAIAYFILAKWYTFIDLRAMILFIDFVMEGVFYARYAILWYFCVNELNVQKQLSAMKGCTDSKHFAKEISQGVAEAIGRLDIVSFEDMKLAV